MVEGRMARVKCNARRARGPVRPVARSAPRSPREQLTAPTTKNINPTHTYITRYVQSRYIIIIFNRTRECIDWNYLAAVTIITIMSRSLQKQLGIKTNIILINQGLSLGFHDVI